MGVVGEVNQQILIVRAPRGVRVEKRTPEPLPALPAPDAPAAESGRVAGGL